VDARSRIHEYEIPDDIGNEDLLKKFTYYNCSKCNKNFFGGQNNCGDEIQSKKMCLECQ
jgi:hypothetical protein